MYDAGAFSAGPPGTWTDDAVRLVSSVCAHSPYVYDKKFITFAESLEFLNSNSIKSSSGKSDSMKSLLKLINEIQI